MSIQHAKKCFDCLSNITCSKGCDADAAPGFKLFGVQIDPPANQVAADHDFIRKTKSLGNLQSCNYDNSIESSGYMSDGFIHQSSRSHEHGRKKGSNLIILEFC